MDPGKMCREITCNNGKEFCRKNFENFLDWFYREFNRSEQSTQRKSRRRGNGPRKLRGRETSIRYGVTLLGVRSHGMGRVLSRS